MLERLLLLLLLLPPLSLLGGWAANYSAATNGLANEPHVLIAANALQGNTHTHKPRQNTAELVWFPIISTSSSLHFLHFLHILSTLICI